MKSQARVVVIGGGVVGCSVLYHLTKAGWKDLVLVERDRLTSGSTWHAAGGFHTLNGDPNVAKLQGYTIGLYDELEKISGQACGLHRSGGLILADTPERLEWLKMAHARAKYLGLETEMMSMKEASLKVPSEDWNWLRPISMGTIVPFLRLPTNSRGTCAGSKSCSASSAMSTLIG